MSPARDCEIDANLLASERGGLERRFTLADLPRLAAAGAAPDTFLRLALQFAPYGERIAVRGRLSGEVGVRCQRCLDFTTVRLDEPVDLVIVASDEDAAGISREHDPVVADGERLDLAWLAEEEALLALPLIALHEGEQECVPAHAPASGGEGDEAERQRPFADLRELLRRS